MRKLNVREIKKMDDHLLTQVAELPSGVHRDVLDLRGPSSSAKCMRELFELMCWKKGQENDDEGFTFELADWRRNPWDFLCNETQVVVPDKCPFVSGNNLHQWRVEDSDYNVSMLYLPVDYDDEIGYHHNY